jgi:hypothetical protein
MEMTTGELADTHEEKTRQSCDRRVLGGAGSHEAVVDN